MITATKIRRLVNYDPATGFLTAKTDGHLGRWKAGRRVGCPRKDGYRVVRLDGKLYLEHRVIVVWMTAGRWPMDEVDHKDRNPADNRWKNLRKADRSQNRVNSKSWSGNSTGFRGVAYIPKRGHYEARICLHRKRRCIGVFQTAEAAHAAYVSAAAALHKEFAYRGT